MVRSGKAPRNLARAKGVGTAASTSRLSVPRPVSPLPRPHPKMCSVSSPFSEGCSSALLGEPRIQLDHHVPPPREEQTPPADPPDAILSNHVMQAFPGRDQSSI